MLTSERVRFGGSLLFMLIAAVAISVPWQIAITRPSPPEAYFWLAVTLVSFVLALPTFFFIIPLVRRKNMGTIFLTYSHVRTSFWHRNKDAILLTGISSAVSFVIGVLLALFGVWLTKH